MADSSGAIEKNNHNYELGSDDIFRIIATFTNDFLWRWDIGSGKLEWFVDIDEILGYGKGEFPRTIEAWKDIIHTDDRKRVLEKLDMHIKNNAPYSEEYRIVKKNGSTRFWIDRGSSIRDASGNATIMIGACSDITEKKETEETLKKSEELYRNLTESLSDKIYLFDNGGCVLFVNSAAASGFNIKRDALICRNIEDIFPSEIAKFLKKGLENVLKNGDAEYGEIHETTKTDCWLDFRLTPIKNKVGAIVSIIGISHDITDRKIIEYAIKSSEEMHRTLTESISDKLYLFDENRCVKFVNTSAASSHKVDPNALVCRSIESLFPAETTRFLKEKIEVVWKTGQSLSGEIYEKIGDDNRWTEMRMSPVKNDLNNITSVIIILHDITKRKKIEEEMMLSEKNYRGLVDNSLVGVYKTTVGGDFIFANGALVKLLGFENFDEMKKNKVISIYKRPEDRTVFLEELKNKGNVSNFETELTTKNGESRNVIITANTSGEIISGMVMDIGDRKKMEEVLKSKIDELERFTKLSVGRELKMVEMKKKIAEFEEELQEKGIEERK